MTEIEDRFTVEREGGYVVYYHKGRRYYWYTVTYNDNGNLLYSHTHSIRKAEYERLKNERD